MRCILAATDGSESANRAVDAAAQIAKRFDAKLLIVNAIDRGVLSTDEMKRFTEVEGMLLGEALTALLSRMKERLRTSSWRSRVKMPSTPLSWVEGGAVNWLVCCSAASRKSW